MNLDLQRLLVEVGAVMPNDHRMIKSERHPNDQAYSSIRSGRQDVSKAGEEDDDWD